MRTTFKTESGYNLLVQIDDEPRCEHCGDNHESFGTTLQTGEGETEWCIPCMNCEAELTDKEWEKLLTMERKEEIKWHEKMIKKLKKLV
jgi:hypothetical protein